MGVPSPADLTVEIGQLRERVAEALQELRREKAVEAVLYAHAPCAFVSLSAAYMCCAALVRENNFTKAVRLRSLRAHHM